MGRMAFIALLPLALAACGSDTDSEPTDTSTEDTTGKVGYDKDATNASNYEIAYQVCGAFPPEKIASDLGISSTDPVDIATAYAEGYTERFRQAGLDGCLDVLTGQPMEWP